MQKQISKNRSIVKQNYDWKSQLQNRITTADQLLQYVPNLPESQIFRNLYQNLEQFHELMAQMSSAFRFAVTPYYLGLANPENERCPVLLQILPQKPEINDEVFSRPDPLAEEAHRPLPGLTHRYPDRLLWYLSHNCAVYCRFCMRKRKVSRPESITGRENDEEVFKYIRKHQELKEVILSGGDPLSLSDEVLRSILGRLKEVKHLASIRIHTRMPVTLPQRFTQTLCDIFKEAFPITIVTHFNHAIELTDEAALAVRNLRMSGALVLNQSVLLKGINDSLEAQEELLLGLLKIGIKPYYLHQCDEVHGVSHFRASIESGLKILRDLQGRNPGIAIPRYVLDLPGGGGKVPLENDYRLDAKGLVYENWAGDPFVIYRDSSNADPDASVGRADNADRIQSTNLEPGLRGQPGDY
ncbi:MAG: KamA family radical SAM protein [Leptospirales bacterium]|nr:KamA family radical SAM protein [Leptospirales bacterium]